MTYQTHTPLTPAEQTEGTLLGASIYDWNDDKLGTISHLHQSGPTPCAVVDVGGFLGIGSKPVALPLSELSLMRGAQGSVHGVTPRSRDEIKAMPDHHY